MILYLNNEGKYLDYRPGNNTDSLLTADEFVGKYIHEIFPERVSEQIMSAIHLSILERKSVTFEYELKHNNNSSYYEARIAHSTENSVVMIVRDISDKVKASLDLFYQRSCN